MKNTLITAICGLGLIAFSGCGKKEEGSSDKGTSTSKSTETKPANAAEGDPNVWMDLELPELGLIASVPGNAKLSGKGSVKTEDWKCRLSVFEKSSSSPSYDNMVSNIEKGNKGGPLKEMVKSEKTDDDNWHLQWTTEKGKFAFAVSKKIGERVFTSANFQADSQEKLDCNLKMWSSLKAK